VLAPLRAQLLEPGEGEHVLEVGALDQREVVVVFD
jgi:hypothetical protein